MGKKLSKYISFLDYFDKSLIVLSVLSGGVSIASFAAVIGAPIGIQNKYKTMLHYCLKSQKRTESIDPKFSASSNGRTMISSKCAIWGSKKSKFIKKQEANGLLSNLGIRTPLTKISLVGDVLF